MRSSQRILYDYFYLDMSKLVSRYCKNTDDAKEVLNDGFCKVFFHIKEFRNESSIKTWMTTIFIREAIKKYNFIKHKLTHFETDVNELNLEDISQNTNLYQKFEIQEILFLYQQLPDIEKFVFNLFVFEGYRHSEIAKLCQITEALSRFYLHSAKNKIKKLYSIKNQYIKTK